MLSSSKKFYLTLIVALAMVGCKFVTWSYLNAITLSSRRECNRLGGEWIIDRENWTGRCEFPEFVEDEKPDNFSWEEESDPSSDPDPGERSGADDPTPAGSSLESCIASPDSYEIQISEPQYYDNDDFHGCESRMTLRNLSENPIIYNVLKVSTLHQEQEGWHRWVLDPSITDTHEQRLWSETHAGETSVLSITGIVVGINTKECSASLDVERQPDWESYIVPVADPCNP